MAFPPVAVRSVYASAAVSGSTVFVGAPEANAGPHTGPAALFALDLQTGRQRWNFSCAFSLPPVLSAPALKP